MENTCMFNARERTQRNIEASHATSMTNIPCQKFLLYYKEYALQNDAPFALILRLIR